MSVKSLPWSDLDGPVYAARELKPRKTYVTYGWWVLASLLILAGIVTRWKIAAVFGALYILVLLMKKDVAVTGRGLEVYYQMRVTTQYDFWPWEEINAIVVEDRNHPELIALHFGRGNLSRRFFFTRPDTQDILILAKQKNSGIPIRQLNDAPRSGGFSRRP